MSESRLRAFAEHAELLVDLPDVTALERRGHDVRARRRTAAAAAALLVAVVGTVVVQDRFQRADEPDKVDVPARPIVRYPGNQMHDLEAGTYELFPSVVPSDPSVLLTVPDGWNTWEGPNRFNGQQPDDPTTGRYNDTPLGRATWYVGVVVVKVLAVGTDLCAVEDAHPRVVETAQQTVEAIAEVPGYRLAAPPERVIAFGHPATHLDVRATPALSTCGADNEADVLVTSANGSFGGSAYMDVWVVDVDGVPLTVVASKNGNVPLQYVAELDSVVDSVEFVPDAHRA